MPNGQVLGFWIMMVIVQVLVLGPLGFYIGVFKGDI